MFDLVLTLCLAAQPQVCAARHIAVPAPDCAAALAAPLPPALTEGLVEAARTCGAAPPDPLPLTEAAPGVFLHRGAVEDVTPDNLGDVSNIAVVIGAEAVAVIDSGGSRDVGERLLAAIRARTDLPIRWMVLTHMHPDHIFGALPIIEAGAAPIGHPNLADALAARAGTYHDSFVRLMGAQGFLGSAPPAPLPAPEAIDLGGRVLTLTAHPIAHSPADLTVFDPAGGILFTGDLVFHEHAPALDGSLLGWIAVLEGLDRPGLTHIVPGHGGPLLSWPEGGAPLLRYLRLLRDETRAMVASGATIREAAAAAGWAEEPLWRLFELFHPRNATAAYAELEWE